MCWTSRCARNTTFARLIRQRLTVIVGLFNVADLSSATRANTAARRHLSASVSGPEQRISQASRARPAGSVPRLVWSALHLVLTAKSAVWSPPRWESPDPPQTGVALLPDRPFATLGSGPSVRNGVAKMDRTGPYDRARLACDFVADGWLARRLRIDRAWTADGPGADKAFVLVSSLPFIHLIERQPRVAVPVGSRMTSWRREYRDRQPAL